MMMASQSSLIQLHQTLLCLMELSWCNKCLTSLLTNLTYQPPHQPHLQATSPTTLPTSSPTSLTSHLTNHLTNLLTNLTYQPPHQPPVPAGDKPGAAPTPSVLQNALYISRLKYLALYASSICLQPGLFTSSQF